MPLDPMDQERTWWPADDIDSDGNDDSFVDDEGTTWYFCRHDVHGDIFLRWDVFQQEYP